MILSLYIYRLTEATTFDGVDDYIDTGIQLFDTNKDFTVFIDFVGDGEQAGNATFPPGVLTCVKEVSPWPGVSIDKTRTNYRFGPYSLESVPYNTTLRQKYIIRKNATEQTLKLIGYHGDREITSKFAQKNLITSTFNANLLLGAKDSNSGVSTNKNLKAFWKGTINQCKVWFKCLTDDEINSLLAF